MGYITKVILSFIALLFAIWTIWIAYQMYHEGFGDPIGLSSDSITMVFLALSCTYLVVWSIQKASLYIAKKDLDVHKVRLYKEIIEDILLYVEKGTGEALESKLVGHKAQLSMMANVPVLQSFNSITQSLTHQATVAEVRDRLVNLVMLMRSDLGISRVGARQEVEKIFM